MLPRASLRPIAKPLAQSRVGLDNPAFAGRLRQPVVAAQQPIVQQPAAPPSPIVKPRENMKPALPKAAADSPYAKMLKQLGRLPDWRSFTPAALQRRYTKLQLLHGSIFGMACLVFVIGVVLSIQTAQTNHAAAAELRALSRH